jgi:hypothetical protein
MAEHDANKMLAAANSADAPDAFATPENSMNFPSVPIVLSMLSTLGISQYRTETKDSNWMTLDCMLTRAQGTKYLLSVQFRKTPPSAKSTMNANNNGVVHTVILYAQYTFHVPRHRMSAVMYFLTQCNYGLILGNFEMDVDDGEVRYKVTAHHDDTTATPSITSFQFTHMFQTALATVERFHVGLETVIRVENQHPTLAYQACISSKGQQSTT